MCVTALQNTEEDTRKAADKRVAEVELEKLETYN